VNRRTRERVDDATGRHHAHGQSSSIRDALPALLAIFLATRLLLLLVAVLAEVLGLAGAGPAYDERPILRALTSWDAVYYLGIAAEGYHGQPVQADYVDWVFFPLFPALVRLVAVPLGDIAVAGVIVANAAAFGASIVLYVLARPYIGHGRALRSVLLVSIAPGAVAFGLAYSDSLFLLLAAGAFLAAERRRYVAMAVLYALAALARPPGILLVLPLAALLLRQLGARPSAPWAALAGGPLALVGFSLYQGAVLGDPLAWLNGQAAWAPPSQGGSPSVVTEGPVQAALIALLLGILLLYVPLLVLMRRDPVPLPHALVAVVAFATVFLSGQFVSSPRFLAVAWPFGWVLASRTDFAGRNLWPPLSAGLFVLFGVLHVTHLLPP